MAMVLTCDGGCGTTATTETAFAKEGYVAFAHYCPTCHAAYKEFQTAVDALHTTCAEQFTNQLALLKNQWKAAHPKAGLPDE